MSMNSFSFRDLLNHCFVQMIHQAQNIVHRPKKTKDNQVTSGTPGRPSLITKFPAIVEVASEFIKSHGYAAHMRRRESVASAPGVSLREIRNHLLENVPGLKERGISCDSVARFMKPPRQHTIAAQRYKGLISARVPGKRIATESHMWISIIFLPGLLIGESWQRCFLMRVLSIAVMI